MVKLILGLLVLVMPLLALDEIAKLEQEYAKTIDMYSTVYRKGYLHNLEQIRSLIKTMEKEGGIFPDEQLIRETAHNLYLQTGNIYQCVTVMFEATKMYYSGLLIPEDKQNDKTYLRDDHRLYILHRYTIWLTEACATGLSSYTFKQLGDIRSKTETEELRERSEQQRKEAQKEMQRRGF